MAILNHIAISLDNISDYCREHNMLINAGCEKYFRNLRRLCELQAGLDVPVFTVYLMPEDADKSSDYYHAYSESIAGFFSGLLDAKLLDMHKIKVSVFGKWYNLPGKAVEALKSAIELTKDNRGFFMNFCISYDGREEIVDACRLIAKQVQLGKLDPEMITRESIKENIYSSHFLAPDVFLIYGERKSTGLLLWDSVGSNIIFADKPFMEFESADFEKLKRK